MEKEIEKSDKLIESLSPIEVKIVPYLNLNIDGIVKKSELDKVSVLRALRFLENKGLAKIDVERKEIIEIREESEVGFRLTDAGKSIAGKEIKNDLIEEVTPDLIKMGVKGKRFRRYDILALVPRIYGGKKHFVNQSIDYA